ncbi:hypothetical protein IPV69_00905 [Humisphaera borealis]|uniref:Glycine zipper domain-containing protein n=2 Tax=Humisphaera borealis TaxID=2807512 RepID=A0A7M2X3T9_9BACT|nr:hypothetical protein IPV69_00905 [Humisphaera borealis]
MSRAELRERDTNPDPITGAPGSHPGGTAVGTTGGGLAGAAAGAAIGSVVPGIGTVVGGIAGAVIGGVGGGLAGKAVAEHFDPTAEDAYWRDSHRSRPYYAAEYDYETDYAPAYRYGYTTSSQYAGESYDSRERDLETGWEKAKGKSRLTWDKAKAATRDAWHRVERKLPGDADRDGR